MTPEQARQSVKRVELTFVKCRECGAEAMLGVPVVHYKDCSVDLAIPCYYQREAPQPEG